MKQKITQNLGIVFFIFFSLSALAQDLAINEVMASNDNIIADADGDYEDWIEIYNYGTTPINLDGFGLSDDNTDLFQWTFPAYVIQPGEYLLIWASDKNISTLGQELHTNFKISAGGEDVFLTDDQGNIVDTAPETELDTDVSLGRQPDGTGSWLFFYTPTPGASNVGTGLAQLMTPPTFSHNSGLYTATFNLSLSHANPNVQIVYTLDGSEPNLSNLSSTSFSYKNQYPLQPTDSPGPLLTSSYTSNVYSTPISIDDRSLDPDVLAVKNPHQFDLIAPLNPVRKATVIKAKAYVSGIESETVSQTYFVWSGGNPYQIPVISLQIQEDYLFDYDDGIYTAGVDFDTWRANNPTNAQYWRPDWNNYWRRGSDWEYPTSVELFEPTTLNSVMNVNGGMRIHGNNSRALAIKNLRLYARSDYSTQNTFEHNLFNVNIPDATIANNNEFKRIMLRGNGSGGPVSYDVVFNRAMQPIYNGVARIQPAIHFINGEYWGLTAIRDRIDKHHFALNFDLDDDDIVMIDCKGVNCELDEGDNLDFDDYIDMRDYILNNNMSVQANFDQAASMLDMKSYIDHMVIEIFAANDSYERVFWKVRTPVNNEYGDGKWRVTVQDFEASLNGNINWMEHWADPLNNNNEALLGALLENTDFQHQFINRFADVMNTVLETSYFNDVVNFTFTEVSPYLVEDEARYPKTDFYESSEQTNLLDWGTNRPNAQRTQLQNYFNLNSVIDITLNVSDVQAGFVKMNTIEVKEETPGVSQNPYPWIGKYFEAIPVTLEAIALPGYEFSHWSGDVTGTSEILTVTPNSSLQVQANFTALPVNTEEVVYFWLMDSDIPNDTPLLGLDATYSNNGLLAAINYISCLTGYPFNENHPDWRTASFERKNSPTDLNYMPEANTNIPYSQGMMKGVQIKQPFQFGGAENYLEFEMPTDNLENIKFSFAVETNGAADTILLDYWDGSAWVDAGLANATVTVPDDYEVREFDFSNISIANDNTDFKIRMRFDGVDMTIDNGDEVRLNNIALTGESTLEVKDPSNADIIKAYPNPTYNFVNIEAKQEIQNASLFDIYGKLIQNHPVNKKDFTINIENLAAGIYFLKISFGNKEETLKLIKR